MLKMIALAVLPLAMAGGALAQTPSNSERLAGGTWTCAAVQDGLNVVSKQNYRSDGTSKITVMVFGETGGAKVRIVAEGTGTWSFVGDRIDETFTTMTATFAEIAGQDNLAAAQDMLEDSMLNVVLSNTVSFQGPTVHMYDVDNVMTDCVR